MSESSFRLRAMAERVELNNNSDFGGCFVIIPPKDGGEPIETLILDNKQDAAQFWSLLQAKATLMVAEIEDKKRLASTFGGRR